MDKMSKEQIALELLKASKLAERAVSDNIGKIKSDNLTVAANAVVSCYTAILTELNKQD